MNDIEYLRELELALDTAMETNPVLKNTIIKNIKDDINKKINDLKGDKNETNKRKH